MGKLRSFDISLNDDHGVYFPGQLIQGHVILELNEAMTLKGLTINLRGKSFVHWTEQKMRGPGISQYKAIRHFSNSEDYVDITMPLLRKASNQMNAKFMLQPGRYCYPFQFQLPPKLPTSFEGEYGYIRYWVTAKMIKQHNACHTSKRVFTVISDLDVNKDPTAAIAVEVHKDKNVCCLCCSSGPISAILCLGQRGYVPGDTINIDAEIANFTDRKMISSSIELKMTTTFHSKLKTRTITKQVCILKKGKIAKKHTFVWNGEELSIPPLPPSHLSGCGIINVKYFLELRVVPAGLAFDLRLPLEIIIGTIPLQSVVQRYLSQQAQLSQHEYLSTQLHSCRQCSPKVASPSSSRHLYPPIPRSPNTPGSSSSHDSSSQTFLFPGKHRPQTPDVYSDQGQHRKEHALQLYHLPQEACYSNFGSYGTLPPYQDTFPTIPIQIFAPYVFGEFNTRDEDETAYTEGDMYFTPIYAYYVWKR